MTSARIPPTLRSRTVTTKAGEQADLAAGRTASIAGLIAVASISGAEAQQTPLPPVTVDAPVARPRPAARPTADQLRARTALRRAARRQQSVQAQPTPFPGVGGLEADRNPYANPNSPYMGQRVASNKFTEPLVNTPKSITVLTKEVLEDKNATNVRDVVRTTPGLTLGTGEGGNAFGDRFFIRGFDARNDVFIDGIRDPAVSIRENFFTEQIEVLKGPASSYAGRGTAGGALNIVTKQASTERDFYRADATAGSDATRRVVIDINKVISPTLAVRVDGMYQQANVAGRDYVFDNRWGTLGALTWTPTDAVKVQANYIHTDLHALPDFGVPYWRPGSAPFTSRGAPSPEVGVPASNFYGFVNRDFQKTRQDMASLSGEFSVTADIKVNTRFRAGRSVLDYIGTLPEGPNVSNPNPLLWTVNANPQSRYQVTDVLANQTDATFKFQTADVRHTAIAGVEASRERVSRDSYTGLTSESLPGGFNGNGSVSGVSMWNPQYANLPFPNFHPILTGNPTIIPVDTRSAYLIDTANYRDLVILNGGVRYDDYDVSATNNQGSSKVHSGMFNYNAGITVKPMPIGSVYAAYATSSNPVGAELDGTSAQYGGLPPFVATNTNQVFSPEINKSFEVGAKWELFDRRALVTAALFETTKENAREVGAVNGVAQTVIAGAAYRVRGVDIGIQGKVTDDLKVFGGLVLMQSAVTRSNIPPANTALFASNVGLPLANIAHQSFNLLALYRLNPFIEVGGQATYVSKIYGGTFLAANQGTEIPAHWRFDAILEGKVNRNLTMKLFIQNILDTRYYDGLYQSATPFVFVAPGRSVRVMASAKF